MRCSATWMRVRPGVAIESSRSRCHSGSSISAATWSAKASRTGLPVMAASWRWKRRSDAFQVARAAGSSGSVAASIAASRFSTAGSGCARGGGEPGDGGLELRARLEHGRRAGVVRRAPAARRPRRRSRTCRRRRGSRRRRAAAARPIASRTEARLTSSARASSRSDGSRSPGASRPERMSAASRSAICS